MLAEKDYRESMFGKKSRVIVKVCFISSCFSYLSAESLAEFALQSSLLSLFSSSAFPPLPSSSPSKPSHPLPPFHPPPRSLRNSTSSTQPTLPLLTRTHSRPRRFHQSARRVSKLLPNRRSPGQSQIRTEDVVHSSWMAA